MSDEEILLEQIRTNFDDDLPRLAYADWLEKNGQNARAEFIRLQCESSRKGVWPRDYKRINEVHRRLKTIIKANASTWLGRFQGSARGFERGFLSYIRVSAKILVLHASELFRFGPIDRLDVCGVANYISEFAVLPQLRQIRGLDLISNRLSGEHIQILVESNCMCNLESLYLQNNKIGDQGAAAIANSPHLPMLSTLRLDETGIGDDGLLALAESPYLGKLKAIYVGGNNIDKRDGARKLCARYGIGVIQL